MKTCLECGLEFDETEAEVTWEHAVCFTCNESALAEEALDGGDP